MACDRNIAPYVAGEQPSQPDLARIFRAPEKPQPIIAPGGAEGAPVAAQVGRPGAAVRGKVNLSSGIEPVEGSVLFIIARSKGVLGGPPLAVQRVANPSFPHAFEIGPDDVMIPSMRFAGPISITARLDADGDPLTRAEADPKTSSPVDAVPGTLGVEMILQ